MQGYGQHGYHQAGYQADYQQHGYPQGYPHSYPQGQHPQQGGYPQQGASYAYGQQHGYVQGTYGQHGGFAAGVQRNSVPPAPSVDSRHGLQTPMALRLQEVAVAVATP